jgi:hypothetical protein
MINGFLYNKNNNKAEAKTFELLYVYELACKSTLNFGLFQK